MAETFEWDVRVTNHDTELWNKPVGTEVAMLIGETSGLVASIIRGGDDQLLFVSYGETHNAMDGECRAWRGFQALMDEVLDSNN